MSLSDHGDQPTPILNAGYEAFVFGIVMLTLVNNVIVFLPRPDDSQSVASIVNNALYAFLIADALYRLWRHQNRVRWLFKWRGWMTMLGSLPVPFISVFRILNHWLWVRTFKRQDMRDAANAIASQRARSTLLSLILTSIVAYEIGAILILKAESAAPNANIKTANDALWWGYVTISTVGYGDRYPVTVDGRIIGVVVITVGVALFSGITGYLADWFRRPRTLRQAKDTNFASLAAVPVNDFPDMIAGLRAALEAKEKADVAAMADLRAQIDALERKVTG